jgi:pyruvate formate lyase activating enzyme
MRLTELVEHEDSGKWRCGVCQWRCGLAVGETGHCLVRAATAEGIEAQHDGMISAANFGPIEEHRLWHFFPDTQVLAIGGWGYAFPADQQRGRRGAGAIVSRRGVGL